MTESQNRFLKIMSELIGKYNVLLDSSRLEETAMASGDLNGVRDAVFTKEILLSEIGELEEHRRACYGELSQRDFTLDEFVKECESQSPEFATRLRSLGVTLKHLVDRNKAQGKKTEVLANSTLGHIEKMRDNILNALKGPSDTYSSKGKRINKDKGDRILSTEL